MAGATKKREARKSLRQPGWITLEGGFAARPCVVNSRRCQRIVRSVAAGIRARCPNGAELRNSLATG
jgi:hypothetical protein